MLGWLENTLFYAWCILTGSTIGLALLWWGRWRRRHKARKALSDALQKIRQSSGLMGMDESDSGSIGLQFLLPDNMSEEKTKELIVNLSVALDDLYRAHGGSGLKVVDPDI